MHQHDVDGAGENDEGRIEIRIEHFIGVVGIGLAEPKQQRSEQNRRGFRQFIIHDNRFISNIHIGMKSKLSDTTKVLD